MVPERSSSCTAAIVSPFLVVTGRTDATEPAMVTTSPTISALIDAMVQELAARKAAAPDVRGCSLR